MKTGQSVQLQSMQLRLTHMKPSRDPDFIIGDPANPYMKRWFIIPRNQQFNIYYHEILRDDDDRALHDHPWESISIVTAGSVLECYALEGGLKTARVVRRGDVIYRPAEFLHRLELLEGPAETLFITGPRVREWGFDCPQGWVSWDVFCKPSNPGEIGRGCGEHGEAAST